MPETREQIIERMAKAIWSWDEFHGVGTWPDVQRPRRYRRLARKLEAIAVKAVTDRVREMHHDHICGDVEASMWCFITHGGKCSKVGTCAHCGVPQPCPTARLLNQIDAELGGK